MIAIAPKETAHRCEHWWSWVLMIRDKTVQSLSSTWVSLYKGREGQGGGGRWGSWGVGVHYTWALAGRRPFREACQQSDINISSESVPKSSRNHKIIVLAHNRLGQHEKLWGGSGFNFGVECAGCTEDCGLLFVFLLFHLTQKEYTIYWGAPSTLHGFCSHCLLLLFFYFLNKLFVGFLLLYVEYFRSHTSVLSVFLGFKRIALRSGFVFQYKQGKQGPATNVKTSEALEEQGKVFTSASSLLSGKTAQHYPLGFYIICIYICSPALRFKISHILIFFPSLKVVIFGHYIRQVCIQEIASFCFQKNQKVDANNTLGPFESDFRNHIIPKLLKLWTKILDRQREKPTVKQSWRFFSSLTSLEHSLWLLKKKPKQ